MSDTIQVTATLVPVGQDLVAKAGDRIMIVAGVAVGVFTGEVPKPRTEPAPLPSPAPKPRQIAPRAERKGRSIAKPRSSEERQVLRDRILTLLRSKPNLSTTEVADMLGYARDDKDRWHVSEELSVLMRGNVLIGTLIGKDARLGRRFRLNEKAAVA